ncbi:MAG: RluA family pseudouridine synthase [Candidatus Binatia bacterium]|nr:RluA family pseudouridine synthase [Candidatus Binatia bacterium]
MSFLQERFVVEEQAQKQRLDRYLASLGRWGSRARVQKLIDAGQVLLDGQPARARYLVRAGQMIEVRWQPLEENLQVVPQPMSLNVVYEDQWILVIDKPAGLVVHPTPTHHESTLVHGLLYRWQGRPEGLDPLRPGIVHRLDKDTSGLIVVAKDPETLTSLGRQFQQRQVEKEYLAAVWGIPHRAQGTVDAPIARDPVHRKRMKAVRQGGRTARSAYRVLASRSPVSLLAVFPETGRTHQIRVHLAHIGHPIVGDTLYGRARKLPPGIVLERHALHATRLRFAHPVTGEPLSFHSPLPPDLQPLWNYCVGPADAP